MDGGHLIPIWGKIRANALAKAALKFKIQIMERSEAMQYLPVLMLGLFAVAFSFGMLVLSVVLGKKGKREPIKDTPYECGMLPIGDGTARLSVKFYLVAMLFILFDIEVVFLYPWAVIYKSMLQENAGLVFGSSALCGISLRS